MEVSDIHMVQRLGLLERSLVQVGIGGASVSIVDAMVSTDAVSSATFDCLSELHIYIDTRY